MSGCALIDVAFGTSHDVGKSYNKVPGKAMIVKPVVSIDETPENCTNG